MVLLPQRRNHTVSRELPTKNSANKPELPRSIQKTCIQARMQKNSRRRGPRKGLTGWTPAGLLSGLVLLAILAGCTDPPLRKRTFVGRASGARESVEVPVGLNPLGSLDVCRMEGERVPVKSRVLVSRPEMFTREASLMISTLREEVGVPGAELSQVDIQLSATAIQDVSQARAWGRHCGALIVLWEPGFTKTLELTLPQPNQIPIRPLVQERLCEFGDLAERLNILYLTIAGLMALRENDYEKAVFHLESAREIDNGCLRIRRGGRHPETDPASARKPKEGGNEPSTQ